MHAQLHPAVPAARPWYAALAIVLELFTGIAAIPVALAFLADPSGGTVGLPRGWIESTMFGSYVVPGLYLLAVNGVGMLVLAGLTAIRHWAAPWLTGVLGAGLVAWILVQVAVMPETSALQAAFLGIGVALVAVSVAWLRVTGQLWVDRG